MSRLVAAIENNPLPLRLEGPGRRLLVHLGRDLGFAYRILLANLWLWEPLLVWGLKYVQTARPLFWTTQAATMISVRSSLGRSGSVVTRR